MKNKNIIQCNCLRKRLKWYYLNQFVIIITKYVSKMHEKVFLGAHCLENLRLLSETSLGVNYYCATFFIDFTHWFSNKTKNHKI